MDPLGLSILALLSLLLALRVPRLVYALVALMRRGGPKKRAGGEGVVDPRISIVIPARQEPIPLILGLLENIAGQVCKPLEVILVWDWPATGFERVARAAWRLERRGLRVRVVAKPWRGRGKASVLNYALRLARGDAILVIDVDDRLADPHTLCRLREALKSRSVVQLGITGIAPLHPLQRPTAVAIHTGFRVIHEGRWSLGLPLLLVGSGLAARRRVLLRIGGFNEESIVEDVDLAIRLHLEGIEPALLRDSLYMSGAPGYRAFRKQQSRWARGVGAVLARHLGALVSRSARSLELVYVLASYALEPLTIIAGSLYAFYSLLARAYPYPLAAYTILMLLESIVLGLHAVRAPVKNRLRSSATAAAMGVALAPVLLVNWIRGFTLREGLFEITPRRVSGREKPGRLETIHGLVVGLLGLALIAKWGLAGVIAAMPLLAPLLAVSYLYARLPTLSRARS